MQDYPELAEPHNNLAAIYAAAGEYGKARAELEEAIRLNPRYAPAHENLGDVHALLAGQSYAPRAPPRAREREPAEEARAGAPADARSAEPSRRRRSRRASATGARR